ncbi:NECA3 protein, partial [Chroicocephalus maculipennis]|nr:NECA3 protein [Chroicocephalus maculipennis]
MACAELLAVCLLSADRGPAAPRRQPLPIFHDVNDGKLSFEEFKNYFADGILSSEELWELFSGIDRRHSDPFQTWLCSSSAEPEASDRSFLPSLQRYETSSKMEQFLTRFLLRETMHQLQSLQASLECAVDTVEEQAGRERKDIKKSETSVGLRSGRRCGRRGQKNICLSPTDPYSGMLTTGISSLAIPRPLAAAGGNFHPQLELMMLQPSADGSPGPVPQALLSHLPAASPSSFPWAAESPSLFLRQEGAREAFPGEKASLRGVVSSCQAPSQGHSCPRSVSACKLTDEACFILYEFWQDVTSWRSHLQSSCSKTFQRSIISLLESPELLTTMLFPASWWIMNNN